MSAISALQNMGLDTRYAIGVVRGLKEKNLSTKKISDLIVKMGDSKTPFTDNQYNYYYMLYLAQTHVRAQTAYLPQKISTIIGNAREQTEVFMKRLAPGGDLAYTTLTDDDTTQVQPFENLTKDTIKSKVVKSSGKLRKGSKIVVARQIFEEHKGDRDQIITDYMKTLQMSKPTAMTYFYNFKSKRWSL